MSDGFPTFEESRGSLLPIELSDVPFTVRRLFVVTGPPSGADRGEHPAPCAELVVLLSGRATFELAGVVTPLERPGQSVEIRRGEYVHYHLDDADSRILVLAEEPYS